MAVALGIGVIEGIAVGSGALTLMVAGVGRCHNSAMMPATNAVVIPRKMMCLYRSKKAGLFADGGGVVVTTDLLVVMQAQVANKSIAPARQLDVDAHSVVTVIRDRLRPHLSIDRTQI